MKAGTAKNLGAVQTESKPALIKSAKSLETRVGALEAVCQPSVVFQLSFCSQGGLQGGAIQVPATGVPMLVNFNVIVLFRPPDTYRFGQPVFSCPTWETIMLAADGVPFTTTKQISNQTFAFVIQMNAEFPGSAKPGDVVTMTLRVSSETDPNFTSEFVQKFQVL